MDQFGVKKLELKAIARTPPLPGSLEASQITSGGWGREYRKPETAHWLGAKVKEIDGSGEMSALGLGDRDGLVIVNVPKESKALRSGFRENDVLRAINGEKVKTLATLAGFFKGKVAKDS